MGKIWGSDWKGLIGGTCKQGRGKFLLVIDLKVIMTAVTEWGFSETGGYGLGG